MRITKAMLNEKLYAIAKENAPVRVAVDKKGRPLSRAVGKKGTNMYSPYPGNLKNNGIVNLGNGVKYDYDKVGYIGYANISSRKAGFIQKTVDDFCAFCVSLGGRIIKR
jgi:hypothetical protein